MLQPRGHGRVDCEVRRAVDQGSTERAANTPASTSHVPPSTTSTPSSPGLRARGLELVGELENSPGHLPALNVRGPEGIIVDARGAIADAVIAARLKNIGHEAQVAMGAERHR